jgi:NitT/TauT family transport system substrate-binding protein
MNIRQLSQAAAVGGLLLAAAVSGAQAEDDNTINVLVPNERTASVYPVLVGQAMGFFEAEGLKVNFLPSSTTVPFVAFLQNGDADLVMLDAPQTFQAVNSGLPVSVIYEMMQFAPEGLVVDAASSYQSLTELKGKTIGLASDRDVITTTIALESVGLSIDDVRTVVVGDAGPVVVRAFRAGQIDAYAGGSVDRFGMEAAGIPFRDLTPAAVSENPANSFVIRNDRKDELRDKVSKFLHAWTLAAQAGLVDIAATSAACKSVVPEQWEDPNFGRRLHSYAVYTTTVQRTRLRGQPQPEVWKAVQPPLIRLGEIQAEVDPAKFLDSSFIEAANNYTDSDLRATIEKWKSEHQDLMGQ